MDSCMGLSLSFFPFFPFFSFNKPTPSLSFLANSYKQTQRSLFSFLLVRVRRISLSLSLESVFITHTKKENLLVISH